MSETRNSNDDRIEILEAASTLISLRRSCDERTRRQRIRSSFYLPHPSMMNPFYGHVWPFYKPHPCDVTSLPMHQPFSFQIPPYMVGPPRPWYPDPQQWLGPMRNQTSATPSLQSPMTSLLPKTDASRMQVATETADEVQDENEDSLGEHDECTPTSADKYEQKRKRRNLSKKQQQILENTYCNTKYPHIEDRLTLSQATQLTEDRIQIWFQNRRAKDRRKTDILIKSPCSAKNQFVIPSESLKGSDGSELDDEGGEGRRTESSPNGNSVIKGREDMGPSQKRLKKE